MNRFIGNIKSVVIGVLFLWLFFFAVTAYCDGFRAAVSLFFGPIGRSLCESFLSLSGVKDWLISAVVAIAIFLLFERVSDTYFSDRKSGKIIGFIAGAIGLLLSLYGLTGI